MKRGGVDSTDDDLPLLKEIEKLPKVELHAHLFGCIDLAELPEGCSENQANSQASLKAVGAVKPQANLSSNGCSAVLHKQRKSIDRAFEYFGELYSRVKDRNTLASAVEQVTRSFAKDNVIYLELRTTLKTFSDVSTYSEYVQIIKEVVDRHSSDIVVQLILSIDRQKLTSESESIQAVEDVLSVARTHSPFVVGIDIAGHPEKGDLRKCLSVLHSRLIDPNGEFYGKLKLTVHTAEVSSSSPDETDLILSCQPHRIGHANYLTEKQKREVDRLEISIEMCPSSNMSIMGLTSLKDHHFGHYWNRQSKQHVALICTDDTGLFETSLSRELCLMAKAFDLTIQDIQFLQCLSISASFAPADVRERLLKRLTHESPPVADTPIGETLIGDTHLSERSEKQSWDRC